MTVADERAPRCQHCKADCVSIGRVTLTDETLTQYQCVRCDRIWTERQREQRLDRSEELNNED